MAITLVVNPGSSSRKYALYKDGVCVLVVRYEKTGTEYATCVDSKDGTQTCEGITETIYQKALEDFLQRAVAFSILLEPSAVTLVAVRVVAPGIFFQHHRVVDSNFLALLKQKENSAPLHIPATLKELISVQETLPKSVLIAVSDSAFHSTMPYQGYSYSLQKDDVTTYELRRFGYHGLSVESVVSRIPNVVGVVPKRLIVCHVGSGVSVTAVMNGKSIDTTMGFSPSSGLPMGTRAGDADAGVVLELMRQKNLSIFDTEQYIQREGGIKGQLTEADLRHALDRKANGDVEAKEALEHFFYHLQKVIGSYFVVLGGLDMIVLTATASERNPTIRQRVLENLAVIGILLDYEKNDSFVGKEGVISKIESPVSVAVMKTDEMGAMQRAAEALHRSM